LGAPPRSVENRRRATAHVDGCAAGAPPGSTENHRRAAAHVDGRAANAPPLSAAGHRQAAGFVDADAAAGGYVGAAASATPILLEQGLIYKTEAVLLGLPPQPPPAAPAAPTAPPPEQPPSVSSPPAVRVNLFTHTMEAGNEAEVDVEAIDLDRRMSMLISSVIGHLLEGGPSLHGSRQFHPSRSLARCPRHCNPAPRSITAPAQRRPCCSQPPRRIQGHDTSCRGTSS
jgi:hypothetical protein